MMAQKKGQLHNGKENREQGETIISEERVMNRQTRRKDNKDERGSALVLTLGILSLVLIMGMSFAFSSRTSRQVAKVNADQVKANLHGESGLDYALGVMQEGFWTENSDGNDVPIIYPAGYKLPDTAGDYEKRFEFKKYNLGFKDGDGNWAHQHIWSYVPKNDKADNSTDDEVDTADVEKNHFDTNKDKHSFYYTLMNEVPQLRLQSLQFLSDSSDSNLSGGEEEGTPANVQSYLKKIGFHTITSDDEIVGRVGFLVLEEGHKFDVNQMLTLKIPASGTGNIPFVQYDKQDRCAVFYEDWNNKDYYYNITGEYKPSEKINGEDGDTIRWGLHMQELDTGVSAYYTNLLKGAVIDNISTKVRWMSYDHLWKGLCPTGTKLDDIYDDSLFKDDHMRFTFFSADEPESWWYNITENIEVTRFDVTGYEWRESEDTYYETTEGSEIRKPATTASANGWEDIANASTSDKNEKIQNLAFVKNTDGEKQEKDDLPKFSKKSDDYEVSDCIPALAGMKDKNGDSVALQVAANMVDYCDGNDFASVYPDDARSKLTSTASLPEDYKIVYCGNEKVAYFNELALQFHASRAYNEEDNYFVYRLRLMPQLEMANLFGKDEDIPVGDIVVRVKGTYDIECSKEGDHGTGISTGHENDHPEANTTGKEFELVFKANNSGGDWSEGYKNNFEFEMVSGSNLIMEYKEDFASFKDEFAEDGTVIRMFYPAKVDYKVKITEVAMISWNDGEGADEKIYDIGWWRASDETGDAFEMKYSFDNDSNTDIDRYYYGTMEANDPRCNHRSVGWAWKKDGDDTFGGFVSNPSTSNDFDGSGYHTLGDDNSNFKPADASLFYGSEETMDKEKDTTKIYEISTAFIRNAPFETLWELGAIHRGEPFRTVNLSIFSDDFDAASSFSGKYDEGDAHILDQVKIGPARYSRGKFNVNSRSVASYIMLYDEDLFGKDDTYDDPAKKGDDLPEPEWDFKDAETSISRGQIASLIKEDTFDDYENDRQMESFIGRTANLLTTRNEAYTVIVISQALQERKDLSDAMTAASMSDAQKKELIKTNMTNPTWYKVYKNGTDPADEHLCEILGTNVIMAHVVRDAWTGKMTVVKKEYLNSSK